MIAIPLPVKLNHRAEHSELQAGAEGKQPSIREGRDWLLSSSSGAGSTESAATWHIKDLSPRNRRLCGVADRSGNGGFDHLLCLWGFIPHSTGETVLICEGVSRDWEFRFRKFSLVTFSSKRK